MAKKKQAKQEEIKQNILSIQSWKRIGIMIIMAMLNKFTQWSVNLIAMMQSFHLLTKGSDNPMLTKIGEQLAQYSLSIMRFLSFHSDERPFPFGGPSPIDAIKSILKDF